MTVGIIVAAGHSQRLDTNQDTAFLCIGSRPIVAYSLRSFESCSDIQQIILVVPRDKVDAARGMAQMFGISKLRHIIPGYVQRQDSMHKALEEVPPEAQFIVVHDASRPLVTPALISNTVKMARKHGTGITAHRVTDAIKQVERGTLVTASIDSTKLWAAETPQAFNAEILQRAYANAKEKELVFDDDATAVEQINVPIRLFEWAHKNLKIDVAEDLASAARLISN